MRTRPRRTFASLASMGREYGSEQALGYENSEGWQGARGWGFSFSYGRCETCGETGRCNAMCRCGGNWAQARKERRAVRDEEGREP